MKVKHAVFVSIASIIPTLLGGTVLAQDETNLRAIGEFAITEAHLPMPQSNNPCGAVSADSSSVSSARLTDEMFRVATCQFHIENASVDELERTVETFAQLQTRGLPPGKQTFSALAEGILHCRIATASLESFRESENQNDLALTRLCEARRRATASFSDVNWQLARFYYGAETNRTVADLVTEYGSCFVSEEKATHPPLHRNIDSDCGLISGIDPDQTSGATKAQTQELLTSAFGENGPIGRLFINKKGLADQIVAASESKIETLEDRAKVVAAIADTFESQGEKISELMGFFEDYKSSYASAQAILRTQARWQDGLLVDKLDNDRNYREVLVGVDDAAISGRLKELEDEAARISEANNTGPYAKIVEIVHDLRRSRDQESTIRFQIRNLCRHFFCELAGESGIPDWEPYELACGSNELSENPLCNEVDPIVIGPNGGPSQKVADLCVQAGFKREYAQIGLEFAMVRQCLAQTFEEPGK